MHKGLRFVVCTGQEFVAESFVRAAEERLFSCTGSAGVMLFISGVQAPQFEAADPQQQRSSKVSECCGGGHPRI